MSKKFNLALNVLGTISQCSPNRPVTVDELAQLLSLSVSYVETVVRTLRLAGLVESIRGPGGGYLPGSKLSNATAGDVYNLFNEGVKVNSTAPKTSAEEAVDAISVQMRTIGEEFLQNFPIASFSSKSPKPAQPNEPVTNVFKLKPAPAPLKPNAPNSIFDMARFGQRNLREMSL